jgi:mycofactocin system glycosyltransferase
VGEPLRPDVARGGRRAGGRAGGALTWRVRLASGVRLRRVRGRAFVVDHRPLAVIEVRPAALRLLTRLRAGRDVLVPDPRPAELRLLRRLGDAGLAELRPVAADLPAVSVIVPVRGRPRELAACLASLAALRYPRDRLEVIVVDDASAPPAVAPAGVRLVRLRRPAGAAGARNAGASAARHGLLAFLDSDCVAEPGWLEALVPELADPEVAAAGGRIGPAAERSWLERYEAVRSPLDLGRTRASVRPGQPVPYLVTANMVVRRSDFEAAGGFDVALRYGEDVDLCWRLHGAGRRLVYEPAGRVRHRHRGRPTAFASTRAGYAGSEAVLLARHPEGGRWLGFTPGMAAAALSGLGAVLGRPRLLAAGALVLGLETAATAGRLRRLGVPRRWSVPALVRGQASGFYWAARQITRYYGAPATVAALSSRRSRPRLLLALAMLELAPAMADWWRLRPHLRLPEFLLAYVLDDVVYQYGLLRSCLRERTLAPLRVRLRMFGDRRSS